MFLTNLCLFLTFAFAVFSYDQFKDLNGLKNDIPQWIIVPEDDHTCNLKKSQNWGSETNQLIVGDKGSVVEPSGKYSERPRYYVKKRVLDANRIQFVALLNPETKPVKVNEPNRFKRQIFALFCQQGTINAIDLKDRVFGLTTGHTTRGKCNIEARFVEFCLTDQDVGTLPNINQIFEVEIPNRQTIETNVGHYQMMATVTCDRFVKMKLPQKRNGFGNDQAVIEIGYYLKGAQKANFGKVLMQGVASGEWLKGEDCQDGHLCWAHYSVDNLIKDTNLVERLYILTNVKDLPSVWYFCKDDWENAIENPDSRRKNSNPFHWLLIEYHQASRTSNLKRVHG